MEKTTLSFGPLQFENGYIATVERGKEFPHAPAIRFFWSQSGKPLTEETTYTEVLTHRAYLHLFLAAPELYAYAEAEARMAEIGFGCRAAHAEEWLAAWWDGFDRLFPELAAKFPPPTTAEWVEWSGADDPLMSQAERRESMYGEEPGAALHAHLTALRTAALAKARGEAAAPPAASPEPPVRQASSADPFECWVDADTRKRRVADAEKRGDVEWLRRVITLPESFYLQKEVRQRAQAALNRLGKGGASHG